MISTADINTSLYPSSMYLISNESVCPTSFLSQAFTTHSTIIRKLHLSVITPLQCLITDCGLKVHLHHMMPPYHHCLLLVHAHTLKCYLIISQGPKHCHQQRGGVWCIEDLGELQTSKSDRLSPFKKRVTDVA